VIIYCRNLAAPPGCHDESEMLLCQYLWQGRTPAVTFT